MNHPWRPFLVVVPVLAVLGLVCSLSPVLFSNLAGEAWALPEQAWHMAEAKEYMRQLDARLKAGVARHKAKDYLTAEVIGGRLSLVEAAACFRDLDHRSPGCHVAIALQTMPGASEQERYIRIVLNWVRETLRDQPHLARKVTGRLEAELADRLHSGTLQFP